MFKQANKLIEKSTSDNHRPSAVVKSIMNAVNTKTSCSTFPSHLSFFHHQRPRCRLCSTKQHPKYTTLHERTRNSHKWLLSSRKRLTSALLEYFLILIQNRGAKMCVLGSREQMCLDETIKSLPTSGSRTYNCRRLVKERQCSFYNRHKGFELVWCFLLVPADSFCFILSVFTLNISCLFLSILFSWFLRSSFHDFIDFYWFLLIFGNSDWFWLILVILKTLDRVQFIVILILLRIHNASTFVTFESPTSVWRAILLHIRFIFVFCCG